MNEILTLNTEDLHRTLFLEFLSLGSNDWFEDGDVRDQLIESCADRRPFSVLLPYSFLANHLA